MQSLSFLTYVFPLKAINALVYPIMKSNGQKCIGEALGYCQEYKHAQEREEEGQNSPPFLKLVGIQKLITFPI